MPEPEFNMDVGIFRLLTHYSPDLFDQRNWQYALMTFTHIMHSSAMTIYSPLSLLHTCQNLIACQTYFKKIIFFIYFNNSKFKVFPKSFPTDNFNCVTFLRNEHKDKVSQYSHPTF